MRTSRRKKLARYFQGLCRGITWPSVALLGILIFHVFQKGADWLDLSFLTQFQSRFPHKAGIKAGLWGTTWLIFLTAALSIPLSVSSAIFLEEYGLQGRLGKIIEINIANLAGVPSIVYGLLGLTVFVRTFSLGRGLLSGALTLSLLISPIIIVSSREAIRAVPPTIRMAAYALGAEKRQTIFGQVLPMALPGILTESF